MGNFMKINLKSSKYKPQFAGHETFYLRYGWLKKAYDAVNSYDGDARNAFTNDSAIATFGVGKNMVSSIRFWAHAFGIIRSIEGEAVTTELGDLLFSEDGLDPYIENMSTLWLLHWNLITDPKHTSVHWLFNYFNEGGFDKEALIETLLRLSVMQEWRTSSPTTVKNDIAVLLNTYGSDKNTKKKGKEDAITSPLAELGLIKNAHGNRYHLGWGQKPSLKDGVFLYALCDFWNNHFSEVNTLNFQSILLDVGSPGRAFLMDENDLAHRLSDIEKDTKGLIVWSETAGLKQLMRKSGFTQEDLMSLLKSDFSSRKVAA
jgi:hypothetical protein